MGMSDGIRGICSSDTTSSVSECIDGTSSIVSNGSDCFDTGGEGAVGADVVGPATSSITPVVPP